MRRGERDLVRTALLGAAAGAAGTAALDLVEYWRYRQGGGTERLISWETAAGVNKWQEASAPGQFGKRLVERITRRELPDRWARSTANAVHWATGVGWGAQFGLANALTRRHRLALSVVLGPAAWLSSYLILPLAKVYKPIWDYDRVTLTKDLEAHMAYGSVTALAFAALARRRGPGPGPK
jgi:hypothetical protein